MSWRKNNKRYNEGFRSFDVWILKIEHPNIKKLRVRNWLKARKEEQIHELKSNY